MKTQNYANHVRYYTPHHFIFYPVVAALAGICLFGAYRFSDQRLIWAVAGSLALLTGILSYMLRQHYALTIQNRLVRMELRFRYHALTGQRLESLEAQLTNSRIYALRFASDEELPELVKRAISEDLTADGIKKAIRSWQPDYMRV